MPGIHGTYRGVFSSLVDDPDFQTLSPEARHTLLTMRLMPEIGPGAIWRAYVEPIASRTGYSSRKVALVLTELQAAGWVQWDGIICWIVNGLRYDPTVKLADEKHRKGVLRSLANLPKRQIVLSFCEYYNLARPFEGPIETHTRSVSPKQNPNPNPKKTEPEAEADSSPPAQGPSADGPDALQQAWNEAVKESVNHGRGLPGLRPCRDLSDSRRKKASIRLKEAELAWHRRAMLKLAHSTFACGGSAPTKEHPKPFRASFDWYVDNDTNCLKAYEGRYDD